MRSLNLTLTLSAVLSCLSSTSAKHPLSETSECSLPERLEYVNGMSEQDPANGVNEEYSRILLGDEYLGGPHRIGKRSVSLKKDMVVNIHPADAANVGLTEWDDRSSRRHKFSAHGSDFYRLLPQDGKHVFARGPIIGKGCNGVVHVGKCLQTGEMVALKFAKDDWRTRDEIRHLRYLGKLKGHAFGVDGEAVWAIPLLPGVTLNNLLLWNEAKWFADDYALFRSVLRRVARHAHAPLLRKGFYHSDLHFSNIMILKAEDGKIMPYDSPESVQAIDFGNGIIFDRTADAKPLVISMIQATLAMTYYRHEAPGKSPSVLTPGSTRCKEVFLDMFQQILEERKSKFVLSSATDADALSGCDY